MEISSKNLPCNTHHGLWCVPGKRLSFTPVCQSGYAVDMGQAAPSCLFPHQKQEKRHRHTLASVVCVDAPTSVFLKEPFAHHPAVHKHENALRPHLASATRACDGCRRSPASLSRPLRRILSSLILRCGGVKSAMTFCALPSAGLHQLSAASRQRRRDCQQRTARHFVSVSTSSLPLVNSIIHT